MNEIAASDTVVEASGHDWNEGQITKEVTCEEDGVKTFTCQNDPSHIRTESISSPGHNYNEGEITTEPTCTTEGEKTLTCQTCGDVKTETIDALGHDWNNGRVTKEATCEEDGVKTFTCGHDSSHTRTEAIPATGHDYDEGEITREPTCTTNGVKTFTCRNCGDSYAVSVPALGHDWNSGKVTKEATCEEDGIRTFTCKHDSSHTRTEVIPASHLLNKTNAVAATCTKDGNIEYWQCEKCDGLFADEDAQSELSASDIVVKATGHDWNDGVVTKEATCDEDGVKTFTCQNDPSHTRTEIIPGGHELTHVPETAATCTKKGNIEHWKCETCNKCFTDEDADNEIAAAETAVAALGHDWNNGRVTREATCEEDGTKTFTCKHDSSHTRTETIPATGHDLEKNEANAATCVKEGNIEYWECSLCGTLFSDEEGTKVIEPEDTVTAVTDHTYGEWTVTEEPTCTEQGVREKVCGVCGDRITEVIPSKGHDWDNDYTIDKAATCTENGSKSIHCSNCDAVKNQKTIEAVGHDWDNGRIIKEATCEEDGVKLYTCTNDPSHTKKEIIRHGHELSHVDAVAATCTKNGNIEYWACDKCDKLYADENADEEITAASTVIRATGHDWNSGKITKPATCEENGIRTFTCRHDAAHTRTEEIPATGHDYDEGEITRNPTCTVKGIKTFTCRNCEDSYAVTVPALGHDWNSGRITKEATCLENGEKVYTCRHDNSHIKTESITGTHDIEFVETVEATCTESGTKEHWHCSVCGCDYLDEAAENEALSKDITIKATGHDYGPGVITKEPTYDSAGTRTYTCKKCGNKKTETIPKLVPASTDAVEGNSIDEITPTDKAANAAKATSSITRINASKIGTYGNVSKKSMKLTWAKVKGAKNYRIAYRKAGAAKWTYKWTSGKTVFTIKNLKKNQLFQFKVTTYGQKDGKWVRGTWSKISYRYMAKTTASLSSSKGSITVKVKKYTGCSGYQVRYSLNSSMAGSKNVISKGAAGTTIKFKNLKKGKKYYIKVELYLKEYIIRMKRK